MAFSWNTYVHFTSVGKGFYEVETCCANILKFVYILSVYPLSDSSYRYSSTPLPDYRMLFLEVMVTSVYRYSFISVQQFRRGRS